MNIDLSEPQNWRIFGNITPAECVRAWNEVKTPFLDKTNSQEISEANARLLASWLIPVSLWVKKEKSLKSGCLVLGVNGAQGSGKTTFCQLLSVVLETLFNFKVCGFSIDDIYLTREERKTLAQKTHPLLMTRGVPGTHDVELGINIIKRLKLATSNDSVSIPIFDKSTDDRVSDDAWIQWHGGCDVVIFEGWCVGSKAGQSIKEPINSLEKEDDQDGIWRGYVNDALKGAYRDLYGLIDRMVMIKAPSFECVLEWRNEQEEKLARKIQQGEMSGQPNRLMNKEQIKRFIAHYERITRDNLSQLPNLADIVVLLDEQRSYLGTLQNAPSLEGRS